MFPERLLQTKGLWLGFYLPTYPSWEHPIKRWLPSNAHVTLLYIGKNRSQEEVSKITACASRAWHWDDSPLRVELTGAGWFWMGTRGAVPIILVNSRRMFAMRAVLMSVLADEGVTIDSDFGFIPHVTLNNVSPTDLARVLGKTQSAQIELPCMHLTCGDQMELIR